jgi:hypothetical protein
MTVRILKVPFYDFLYTHVKQFYPLEFFNLKMIKNDATSPYWLEVQQETINPISRHNYIKDYL